MLCRCKSLVKSMMNNISDVWRHCSVISYCIKEMTKKSNELQWKRMYFGQSGTNTKHWGDVTWTSRPLKSLATQLFVQQLIEINNKEIITCLLYWPFVRGIHWSPLDSPHKGPVMWRAIHVIMSVGSGVFWDSCQTCHVITQTCSWNLALLVSCEWLEGVSVLIYSEHDQVGTSTGSMSVSSTEKCIHDHGSVLYSLVRRTWEHNVLEMHICNRIILPCNESHLM